MKITFISGQEVSLGTSFLLFSKKIVMNELNQPLLAIIKNVAKTKNLSIEEVVFCLKTALEQAYKKHLNSVNVEVNINFDKGIINVEQLFNVVSDENEDYDDFLEIPLQAANKINSSLQLGDVLRKPIPLKNISSDLINKMIAIFNQKISETNFKAVMSEFSSEVGEVIEAKVEDIDTNKEGGLKGYIINLETTKGYISKRELSKGERLEIGKKYLFVIKEIQRQASLWPITLSRSDTRLLQFLLTSNTPEIENGTIVIKKIERSPGVKSKIAVISNDPAVDPVAAILGPKGEKIRGISEEFNGEIIDIVFWNEDKLKFLINAILPAEVIGYNILQDDERDTSIEVVVPANQIANVFGFKGVNIRLISNLTGWNSVDVYSEKDASEANIKFTRLSFEPEGLFGIKKRREKIISNDATDKVFYTSKDNVIDDEIIVDLAKDLMVDNKQKQPEQVAKQVVEKSQLEKQVTPKEKEKVQPKAKVHSNSHSKKPAKPNQIFSITVDASDKNLKKDQVDNNQTNPQTKQTFDSFDDL